LRLVIGRDTELLFHRGRYSGWMLGSPIAHLAAPGTDDPRLHERLREYLALVVEPNIARMGGMKIPICVRRYVRYELVSKPSMEGKDRGWREPAQPCPPPLDNPRAR
jgi:hypothetical protein